ncbi:MAG TPA: hypothetical protein VGB12_07235, partial [bacterium]
MHQGRPRGASRPRCDLYGGGEGRFYVWTPAGLEAALGKGDAALFAAGNFAAHTSVLYRVADDATLAQRFDSNAAAVADRLRTARGKLLAAR